VNVDSAGNQSNGPSHGCLQSAGTRFVAFHSIADNLVPGDTNGAPDAFVHDLRKGRTTRVSVDSTGAEANLGAGFPATTPDGRYVAFESASDNLVPGDTNDSTDVFVHDRLSGQTSRVSIASSGQEGQGASCKPQISADGRYVAFSSEANNLVPHDTNARIDVFVHDRWTGRTLRASVSSTGAQGNGWSDLPSISPDGSYVVFSSKADNLVPGDTNGEVDVFIRVLR